ncbi:MULTISPECIES: Uma2 family endonuclease [unclassified Coleofasciculus]|uniref:Uma2 family endonuclease n=1 Tax=unclassified Coleofasciculus TaxID=2692782 RepID=UPI001880820F|nr:MULTISPECIES: Uma2 family endonuclease [unclassified Coleofasciculus]MBE9129786.1 Uma2 family endonuclease [Coleofasciculus sp. LEGE 07081]MBE9152246.1 Uma2 family endonuclease [Coleofasciculus sp. LEGE 07092]
MVATPVIPQVFSLEDYMQNPPDGMEWVDGKLVEKNGMTFKHSVTQARLTYYWRSYALSSRQGGEVLTEAPCRTNKQGRRPDVAYITPELLEEYGKFDVLPVSFPLIAEVASPTDLAEDFLAKATEYLESGCQEVWLILPENKWIFVVTQTQRVWFTGGEVASTQVVLSGFSVAVDELLA